MQNVTQKHHLVWQSKSNVSRQVASINVQILRAAFSLPKPLNSDKPSVTITSLPNGDYAIVTVNKITDNIPTQAEQQQRIVQNEIENSYGQLEYQLYTDDLMQHAKIKMMKSSQ